MKIFRKRNLVVHLNKSGFTLIEMLVVLSVLGILFGIASYNNSRVLNNSRDTALKVQLNELRTAVYRYALNNSGNLPASLAQLEGSELQKVPVKWQGSRSQGRYFLDLEKGLVLLYDDQGANPSEASDAAGKKYADY
ncbi:MAG: type II secretion system protein [Candidatus Rifleibacteriota bacterium]